MRSLLARLQSIFSSVFNRKSLEADMEEEIRFHLAERTDDLMRKGFSQKEALRTARLKFGGVTSHKDGMRDSLGLRWLDEITADIRYGVRVLRRSKSFAAITIGSLTLAIGASTTIFSLANAVIYAHLGVPHAEQLKLLTAVGDRHTTIRSVWGTAFPVPAGTRYETFTYPVYKQLQTQDHSLQNIFAFKENVQANVTVGPAVQAVRLELVSGNLYQQMQVVPVLGRGIQPADDLVPGSGTVAVLSYSYWQTVFGGSPDVLGKVIKVNTTPVTVIGVNPRGFTGAQSVQNSPEIFLPLSMIPLLKAELGKHGSFLSSPDLWWVQLMARSKQGVSTAQAQAALNVELNAAVRGTMRLDAESTIPHMVLEDGSRGLNLAGRQYARPIYVLLTLVGLVLLLACTNIANLMMARTSARSREMSVRLALGASRSRIVRQVLTESLILSALGGLFGLVLGYLGRNLVPRLMLNAWERSDMVVPFDWHVFGFTALITLATAIMFGTVPAIRATQSEIGVALKEGSQASTKRRNGWAGKPVVVFQVFLSTLLVAGSAAFLRTLINLNAISPGFQTNHLILFDINPPSKQYSSAQAIALSTQIAVALRSVPGVEGVALTDIPLLADSQSMSGLYPEGSNEEEQQSSSDSSAMEAYVGRDFLSVMGIPLLRGRSFKLQDRGSSQPVTVVSESLVKKFFPNQDPIGRRFSLDGPGIKDRTWLEIVGVFADIRYAHLKESPPPLHFDLYEQSKDFGGATFVIRTKLAPEAIAPSLRAAVQRIDSNIPLMDIRSQQQQIDATMQQERIFAGLTLGFGLLALILACVGIYGIMTYTVAQRANEFGIRLALGASRNQVRSLVFRDTISLAFLGVALGIAGAVISGQFVRSMLYGMSAADPVSLIGTAALLLCVAYISGWLPATRASRMEPMNALRSS